MRNSFFTLSVTALLICTIFACSKDSPDDNIGDNTIKTPLLPDEPFIYAMQNLPIHLTTNTLIGPIQTAASSNDNTPQNNPITNEGATLGRVLFYDVSLSANGKISCSSCHQQSKGFSDDKTLSQGFKGGHTRRHSMSLINARWYDRDSFFWDERAETLEDQVLMPIQDTVEMGLTLDQLISVVEKKPFYAQLFKDAFGTSEVTPDRIAKALAQYVRSIVSLDSKYDQGRSMVSRPTDAFPNFTDSENRGKTIFNTPINLGGAGCNACHTTEAFITPPIGPANNGLDEVSTDDLGIFESNNNPAFRGTFKAPSLKSIGVRAPYMHDGRFSTLEEVIEHYNSGVQNHPNLGPPLRTPNGTPVRLNLSDQEKQDLLHFLLTLTDESLASDPKFSDPFL